MTKEREKIVINDAVSISAGDFESVFRRLYTPLFYHAFDIVGDSELARDIVSEVFTRVWKEHRDLQQAGLKTISMPLSATVALTRCATKDGCQRYPLTWPPTSMPSMKAGSSASRR